MKSEIKKSDIIWNYIGTAFNMGFGVISLPVLLKYLDDDRLGLWYVMLSISAISNLFTFGFTPAFARNVNYCWNGATELLPYGKSERNLLEGVNYRLLYEVMESSRIIYLIIALLSTSTIGVFGTWHILKISQGINSTDVHLSWLVFVISIFINIYYAYYSSYLIGIGKVKENNQIMVLAYTIRLLVMFFTMYFGMGLTGAALSYFFFGIINRTLCKCSFYSSEEGLKCKLREHSKEIKKLDALKRSFFVVWYNAWRDGIVSVAEYLATQVSTIVCSSFFSLAETAMFSLTAQLVGMIGKIAKSIYNVYSPVFQKAYITNDLKTAKRSKCLCQTIFIIVFFAGIVSLEIPGIYIIRLIRPSASLNRLFILIYAVYQFMLSRLNGYAMYLSATNRVIYWRSLLITRTVVLIIYTAMLYFFKCGPWGIIAISILGELAYNFWKYSRMVKYELNLNEIMIYQHGLEEIKKLVGRKSNG